MEYLLEIAHGLILGLQCVGGLIEILNRSCRRRLASLRLSLQKLGSSDTAGRMPENPGMGNNDHNSHTFLF
jgi:hypothetical protein